MDEIARSVLADLVSLPGVSRVGLGLSEGGGRRIRFVSTDANTDVTGELDWCHIDAYDDVPLTTVVRTGHPVVGRLDALDPRYSVFVDRLRDAGTVALAAFPLPGTGSPMGGLVVFFDVEQSFDDAQCRLLEAAARRTSEAVRRVRRVSGHAGADEVPDESEIPEGSRSARVLLEGDPRASSAARHFLRQELVAWQVDDAVADTAEVCLSEIVTNAVVHAGTVSELRVTLKAEVLTVVVRDLGGLGSGATSREAQPTADPDPMRVHGRGLMLVEAMADRWGSERDATGMTVWFALELEKAQDSPAQTG